MNDSAGTGSRFSSIHLRLLAANLLILPLFLGLTAWGLDRAFGNYQSDKQQENMRLQQLLLAKAAEWDGAAWNVEGLDEPRLELPDSGLYAYILSRQGTIQWQSISTGLPGEWPESGVQIRDLVARESLLGLSIAGRQFSQCDFNEPFYCYGTFIAWGSSGPESLFLVLESQRDALAARDAYRRFLALLCLGLALMLVIVQLVIVRWGLLPLGRITRDIESLKRGEQERLEGEVPRELVALTNGINVLLDSEERRRERVRNTVDRLTHTLKTPLMLVRNSDDEGPAYRELVDEQVTRILGIVEGELARARLDGRAADILGKSVDVKPVLERIARAYQRLPRVGSGPVEEMQLDTSAVNEGIAFLGEERDLQDLFGSILENSIKYCQQRICISCELDTAPGDSWLVLTVGDDGDGIPEGYERVILERGARADTAVPGQGLGLAIALEIVSAYGGSLHTAQSLLGGAEFVVRLPAASYS